jgi:hypothetical protein
MKLLVCMLLLASPASIELLDETPTIAAGKWNYYAVNLRQRPARITAKFEVLSADGEVNHALQTHGDAERLFHDTPHGVLVSTGATRKGTLSFPVPRPDDYDIVVDNREGLHDVSVRVRVSLDFGVNGPAVVTAAPMRQLTVIGFSFLFFFAVVTYSARRILRTIGR